MPSIQPKLLDVLRLLYSTLMLSQLDALAEGVKSSVAVLLKEIIKLSGTKKAKSKVSDAEKVKAILNKDKEMKTMAESDAKSEQWECPRYFLTICNHLISKYCIVDSNIPSHPFSGVYACIFMYFNWGVHMDTCIHKTHTYVRMYACL